MAKLLEIDPEQVKTLAAINCTYDEMAAVLGCSDETLRTRFMDAIKAGRAIGRQSVRRAQWKAAIEKGNITMLIWLGKQLLGQSEKVDAILTHRVVPRVTIEDDQGMKTVISKAPLEITDGSEPQTV